jgi:acyl-CoA-binding protein
MSNEDLIHTKFEHYIQAVKHTKKKFTVQEKLKLYGYFKQATIGICNKTKAKSIEEQLKLNEWKKLKDMSMIEAKENYNKLATSLGI